MTKTNLAPSTHAGLVRVLDDPDSTPEDVKRAAGFGVIPGLSARIWLVGYLAGLKAAPARPAQPSSLAAVPVKLHDEA